jgi:hypothetical protein
VVPSRQGVGRLRPDHRTLAALTSLADFGFATYRLTDDCNGADFLAVNFDGSTLLRVQLKGRLTFEKKYQNKNLWVCFRHSGLVYLYPHDVLLAQALKLTKIANTESWRKVNGG